MSDYIRRRAQENVRIAWTEDLEALIASVIEDCAKEAEAAMASIVERRKALGPNPDNLTWQYASGMLSGAQEAVRRIRALSSGIEVLRGVPNGT